MNDEVKQEEAQVTDDDWAAAMGEQAVAEGAAAGATAADDDWAAALGEQAAAEKAVAAAAPAKVFDQLSGGGAAPASNQGFELILDIPVSLTVELGRTKISIRNLLQLAHGSVVELDGLAGEPMDVLINGTLIAQGEV
ncbi:MAG: FliM/FliN family flagellar motor switch protein, partial [Rhodocyclaceae bacterium]|nr:FliM/FliN family flagellar motor switch protein [Rhodocyclaceae bacterium]